MTVRRESSVERAIIRQVRSMGGIAYKWDSTSSVGVPDLVVLIPGLEPRFVEVKAPGRHLRPDQQAIRKQWRQRGFDFTVVSDVKAWADQTRLEQAVHLVTAPDRAPFYGFKDFLKKE